MINFLGKTTKNFLKNGKKPRHAYTHTNLLYKQARWHHVPVAVLAGKEVDMPYVLWENLHRVVVRTRRECCLKINHPMLHTFYRSMEAQLCAITKCRPESHKGPQMFPSFQNNASHEDSIFQWLSAHIVILMQLGHELPCCLHGVVHINGLAIGADILICSMDLSYYCLSFRWFRCEVLHRTRPQPLWRGTWLGCWSFCLFFFPTYCNTNFGKWFFPPSYCPRAADEACCRSSNKYNLAPALEGTIHNAYIVFICY